MGYEFRLVDISLFDFHLAPAPTMAADSIQPKFAFLAAEGSYNAAYKSGKEVDADDLVFRPLGSRMITHQRFWRHYHTIRARGDQPNFWNVQMPFIGRPKDLAFELFTGSNDFAAEVWPTIYLTAMGWSTTLRIRLRGKMTPDQLRGFVTRLGSSNDPPFRVGGKPMRWQDVFLFFAQLMKKSVYTPQLIERKVINRRMIISLSRYSGQVYAYQGNTRGLPVMTVGDRAALHSILLGDKVGVSELLKMEGKDAASPDGMNRKGFLLTLFPHDRGSWADFAITNFQLGTLIFMQQIASEEWNRWSGDPKKWKRHLAGLQCHTANVRHYMMMTLSMLEFYNDTKDDAAADPALKSLRANIRKTLIRLPSKYTNRLCQGFHKYYGGLKDFQPEESEPGRRREEPRW